METQEVDVETTTYRNFMHRTMGYAGEAAIQKEGSVEFIPPGGKERNVLEPEIHDDRAQEETER